MATEVTIRNCSFAFRCKQKWEEMTPTRDDGSVRFCLDCMKEVFHCATDRDLVNHVRLNHCISITRVVRGKEFRLLGDIRPKNRLL